MGLPSARAVIRPASDGAMTELPPLLTEGFSPDTRAGRPGDQPGAQSGTLPVVRRPLAHPWPHHYVHARPRNPSRTTSIKQHTTRSPHPIQSPTIASSNLPLRTSSVFCCHGPPSDDAIVMVTGSGGSHWVSPDHKSKTI